MPLKMGLQTVKMAVENGYKGEDEKLWCKLKRPLSPRLRIVAKFTGGDDSKQIPILKGVKKIICFDLHSRHGKHKHKDRQDGHKTYQSFLKMETV